MDFRSTGRAPCAARRCLRRSLIPPRGRRSGAPSDGPPATRYRAPRTGLLLAALCLLGAALAAAPSCARAADSDAIRGELLSGRYPDAERHARELLLETERLHGADSREAAEALDLLAEALRRGGKANDPEALSACQRSLALKERLLAPDDPSLAISLENLGALDVARGELAEARAPLERALEIRTRAFGTWHPDVARSLTFLASLEFSSAREDSAQALVLRAIAIQDSVLPAEDPVRAQALTLLAGIYYERGEYRDAGTVFERALALQTRTLGPEHPFTASTLHNLGALASEMGDIEEAERYLEQARTAIRHSLRPGHPMLARTLVALALIRERLGDSAGARPLYDEALRIQRAAYGPSHADVAWTLLRIGRLELARGRYDAARRALSDALRIQEKVLSPDHPDLAWTLSALAQADARRGAMDSAIDRCARALAVQEKALGPRHPDLAPTIAELARFRAMKGDTTDALELALRASRIRAEHLLLTAQGLSERQALAYAATGPTGLDVALSLIAYPGARGTPASVRQTWDAVVQTRTLVLDEMAARHRATLEGPLDEATANAAETLRGARQRLANLLVRGPLDDPPERYQALVRRARLDMERAERDLGARSEAYRSERSAPRRGLANVFESLPSGWGLVAYTVYRSERGRRYIAFVQSAGGEPAAVPIGDADRIDALVHGWAGDVLSDRSDAGPDAIRTEKASRRSGRALRAAIWDPVRSLLGNVAGVLIVPDASLHGVSFAALPNDSKGYLVEDSLLFHYVTSELDIVGERAPSRHGSGLLAFGGIDFGPEAKPRGGSPAGRLEAGSPDENCAGFYDVTFPPLPQSLLEVQEVARAWGEPSEATVVTGSDATEAAFKRLAPGKRVLHLATHGFFLDPNQCVSDDPGVRGIGGLESSVRSRRRPSLTQQNPLLLSGLALAAANRRSEATPHQEDGVLTAEEVASLDLRGVEWAVLSACDTGVAGTSRGEEILGLRRAFQTAGVATLVMSLWPVQDQAAREWMRALYHARIHEGAGTAQAVRAAMLEVLRSRRAQGRSTSPSFWAAFLAAGDWN